MSPRCGFDLEDSNNNNKTPHASGSWCCIAVPNLVTKCSVIQKISSGQTLTLWPFAVTLTLNALIHFFSQDTLASDDVSSDQVWLPRNQQFRKYSRKNHILVIWALVVTLTLNIAKKYFRMTFWLMTLHHHTKFSNKFGCKRSSSLEDIVKIVILIIL